MILNNEDGLFKMKLEDGTRQTGRLFLPYRRIGQTKIQCPRTGGRANHVRPLRDVIPEGAVLIVGEAHYTYPVRAAGHPVPPYIQELTELRHHGHTVILMTWHPEPT
ncbi:zonular occludens toxin domain-containing protein [Neisseria gonorrhoeae]|uniref:zonular occludens toxin domain-containing protein n=1 Tax=Neisseria gonorrhoeae TaxID=485 RepID=UPI0021A8AF35|nr:zonular occludens toxin domain-containing protein [Neisseria gonorrhoeae]UWT36665.1 zonular occludens toxin domain-containing protein [Neisseria gonorrhoeae]